MKNKFLSLFILALVTVTLTACGGQENTTATQEWSSESQPETSAESAEVETNGNTEVESAEGEPNSDADIQAGNWTLDTEKSTMKWTGSKIVGASHSGTIQIKEGMLEVGENGPTGGEFVVDMTTIKDENADATLEEHLRGDDFFAVEKFPESKLAITKVTPKGQGSYDVQADLTIRDITKPIEFEATAQYDETEKTLAVKADFAIDRTQWDIQFNSSSFFQNLGDNAINDEMEFELDLGFFLKQA